MFANALEKFLRILAPRFETIDECVAKDFSQWIHGGDGKHDARIRFPYGDQRCIALRWIVQGVVLHQFIAEFLFLSRDIQ